MTVFGRRNRALVLMMAATSIPACGTAATVETVVVTGARSAADQPNSLERVTAPQARERINAVDTEDLLKYTPSLVVRKRHYGDTQDPVATRTSGVGASARTLIFVDGILISSPIGNNNTSASPHFGVVAPQDVSGIDILYGPFAAEYAGNSIGAVLNITTRMPDRFEAHADALGAAQPFSQYGTEHTYGTWQISGGVGDRDGGLAWRLSANHLDTTGQPLAYVTLTRPAATSAAGTPAGGAFDDLSRTGAPVVVIGAGGIEHQVQDTDTAKLAYDLPHGMQLGYTASVFHQQDDASAETYLRNTAGLPVYSGSVNIANQAYSVAPSSFSNNVYDWSQTHLAQPCRSNPERPAISLGRSWPATTPISTTISACPARRCPPPVPAAPARSPVSMAPAGTRWMPRACGRAGPATRCPSASIAMPRPSAS